MLKSVSDLKWNGEEVKILGHDTTMLSALAIGLVIQGEAVSECASDSARLRKSIVVQTTDNIYNSPEGAPVESGDVIEKPENDLDVKVGTNVDYSWHVEFGTGKHMTDDGAEDFVKNITEWCRKHGIDNPWPVIQHIRMHGTEAQPFMRPAFDLAKGKTLTILMENGKKIFKDYLKK
jgi:hypothetical protein